MSAPTKLEAIVKLRCPRCRKGEIFTHPGYHITKFDNMHEDCPVCGLHYEVEVGLFYGAMYISYGFSVALVLIVGVLLYYLAGDPSTLTYILTVSAIAIVTAPFSFRYSRVLMLHFFSGINYNPTYSKV